MAKKIEGMTNKKFAKESVLFQKACKIADTKPTSRQASKFRNARKGKTNAVRDAAGRALIREPFDAVINGREE